MGDKLKKEIMEEFDERFNWIGWRYDKSVYKSWKDEKRVKEIQSFIKAFGEANIQLAGAP